MATRTAPAVDGTPNVEQVSFRFIDRSGDKRAVSIEIALATVDADIETLAAALAANTNASLYEIVRSQKYYSPPVSTNATAAEENSVYDNIVLLAKSNTGDTEELFIPAPERGLFVGDTDNPDAADTDLQAIIAAFEAVASGTKVVVSGRYTERREKNQSVPL